jgi:quinoprotein glucose dehydrogenase
MAASANARPPYIYATLLLIIGLALAGGGSWLLSLGGSPYYLVAGLMVIGSAILLYRGRAEGAWLYGLMLSLTIAWSLWEIGFDWWGLTARIVAPTILGLWLLLPQKGLTAPVAGRLNDRAMWGIGFICLIAGALLSFVGPQRHPDPMFQTGTTTMPAASATPVSAEVASGDWLNYGNDPGGKRFSPLGQITPANVQKLKVAWSVPLGDDAPGVAQGLEVTPLKIADTVYACNGRNDVFALDAETGAKRWTFHSQNPHGKACRGLAYYKVPTATTGGQCAERIYTNTTDARLIALDAKTGTRCADFGDKGTVNLLKGMSAAPRGYYAVTSAPTVVRGKIVLGGWVSDGQYWGEPSGVIRAFDAVTGQFAWAFDMGRPGETKEPAPGQTYTHSTPNSWAPMSADEDLGLVYFPTGNATPDYYGAQRRPFDDQYSSSVIAVDAETGAVRWHFQTTHHDLWDYDVASQPTLIDIPTAGGGVEHALIQPTKRGELFLLDRVTGKPLADVNEHTAPQKGKVASERLSPTQPFSDGMPSFRGPILREADMWGLTPVDQMICRIKFKQARYEGPVTPVGEESYAVVYPGYLGGFDWGGVTVDPDRHLLIANSSRFANYDKLISRAAADKIGLKPVGADANNNDLSRGSAQGNTPYAADVAPFQSPLGAPCQAPPYGYLSAIDLTTHKIVWTHPIGTARDTGPFGKPSYLPLPMGQPNEGASVVTRGGVIFIAATADRYIRAYDVTSGKLLWQSRLPSGGQATPITYTSPQSGRQFVVIASSASMLQSHPGNALIAYALPK